MYNNYNYGRNFYRRPVGNRIIGGGFLVPFILGGITGGLLAPAFYPRPYPIYHYIRFDSAAGFAVCSQKGFFWQSVSANSNKGHAGISCISGSISPAFVSNR